MFTMSNTKGYNLMDIVTMNMILESRMEGHTPDDPNYDQIEKEESERVQSEYDRALADQTMYMLPETGVVDTRVGWYCETEDGYVVNAVNEGDVVAVVWNAEEQCWVEKQ